MEGGGKTPPLESFRISPRLTIVSKEENFARKTQNMRGDKHKGGVNFKKINGGGKNNDLKGRKFKKLQVWGKKLEKYCKNGDNPVPPCGGNWENNKRGHGTAISKWRDFTEGKNSNTSIAGEQNAQEYCGEETQDIPVWRRKIYENITR